MSYREAAIDIISIAQQARPNDIGQIELRRAQFTTLSSEAKRIPSSLRKFSFSPGSSSVTPLASSTAISSFCLFAGGIANDGGSDEQRDQRGDKHHDEHHDAPIALRFCFSIQHRIQTAHMRAILSALGERR